jgi:pSer/pThr/pTyr-binding forkhead associated (FHA) protein
MALLELGQHKFPIPMGEVVLGSDPACAILLGGAGVLPRHALLLGQADGQVVIRKATPAAELMINGVRLGSEPTPLLHGDKVEVGGQELTFVDERRSGSTQSAQAVQLPEGMGQARPATRPGVTGNTGGRVVSLTDGREYVITGPSLVFGREAGCDVVVSGQDVSRRHAEITQSPRGYLLADSSTNGTFVNEARVEGQRILQRADVIRIGDEQFRFYADAAAAPTAPPPRPVAGTAEAAPQAPAGAGQRLKDTVHGLEQALRLPQTGALAGFLVKSGVLKGQRLQVRTPVANVGRADYNDLVLPDPSVSTSHAKLQRREGVWVLVDLDSTNGSFVDGERVQGESPLAPGALVRFGDVELVFAPTDDALRVAKGGGTQMLKAPAAAETAPPASRAPPAPPAPSARPAPPAPPARPASVTRSPAPAGPKRPGGTPGGKRPQTPPPPEQKGKGCGAAAAILLVGGVGVAAFIHWLLA